ncbi:MAG: hypothetical protein JWP03_411 [Phycisphaerales bacterium]|nr:hypothetical protein [Phycisphaerales bacterium]
MRLAPRLCLVAAALWIAASAPAAGPKGIFDDDWTPPKASEPRKPSPSEPVTPPASNPPKVDPPKTDTPSEPVSAPSSAPAARREVPGKAEQAAVRKVLKEVFAEQLADRSIAGRRKLTEALLAQAEKSGARPADQFVLLAAAVDAGTEAANLPLAFTAGDRMADGFDVDRLALKAETAAKLGSRAAPAELATDNVTAGLALVDQLARAENFAAAARVCSTLLPIAGSNAALRAEVQQRQRDLAAARDAGEKVARQVEKLKTTPDDPAANFEVGKYLCFYRNDWKAGVAALSRGSDGALRALAMKELAGADSADAQASLGDAWWDLAQASTGSVKAAVQAHAVAWYKESVPGLDGLPKAKVEKRIAEAAKSAAPIAGKAHSGEAIAGAWVDLAPMIDLTKHVKAGKWKLEKGVLTSDNSLGARIQIPYLPPEEYDYRIVFSRNDGGAPVVQFASRQGKEILWNIGWKTSRFALNDKDIDRQFQVANGHKATSLIKVRRGAVQFFLDDRLILEESDEGRLLDTGLWYGLPDKGAVGIGSHMSSTSFYSIEIREVSGKGSALPE